MRLSQKVPSMLSILMMGNFKVVTVLGQMDCMEEGWDLLLDLEEMEVPEVLEVDLDWEVEEGMFRINFYCLL